MFRFRNISIRTKLVLMQVLISYLVLGMFFVAYIITDIKGYKQRKVKSVNTIAQVISSGSISALQFVDNAAAQNILAELKVEDDIQNAAILDRKGNLFASYNRPGYDSLSFKPHAVAQDEHEFTEGYLIVYSDISKDNELIGTVCIRTDLAPLNDIIKEEVGIGIVLMIIALGLSLLITLFVQRFISQPLLSLVNVMQSIIGSGDYKKRADVQGKDEITKLSQVFNEMLDQIERRDNELETRVKERTSELESANKEMESFSYSVSHDMRAPLRAVSGFAKIVTNRYSNVLDEDGKDALNIINSETSRMGQLIDDLLAFSRLGKKEIQKSKIDMNSLADSALKEVLNYEKLEHTPKITLDDLPVAYGDSVLIRQVLTNLISNAIKYSGHCENPVIHIGSYTEAKKNVYYVQDNGVGFDMKYYHKLFGVFQRLHTQPEFKGTGIGLAIVQKIVVRHGGTVWAEGKVNEGAKFFFSVPN